MATLNALPPLDKITYQTYFEYFPDAYENKRESFFPESREFQGDLSPNNPYGRSRNWKNFKAFMARAKKYIPGIPEEAKYKPDPEEKKRAAYLDELDKGHWSRRISLYY